MSGLDDLINSTLDSMEQSDHQSKTDQVPKVESAEDPLRKLLEAVGSNDDNLKEALQGLQLGDLLDGIEAGDIEELFSQAESLLNGAETAGEGGPEKLTDLLAQLGSSDISDEDKKILKQVQAMVSDLDSGEADEAAVVARAFELINKLKE
jgi:hypothetical protein